MQRNRTPLRLAVIRRILLTALMFSIAGLVGLFVGKVFASSHSETSLYQIPFSLTSYDDAGLTLWQTLVRRVQESPFNLVATVIFVLAIIHTFFASRFTSLGHRLERLRVAELRAKGIVYDKERDLSFTTELLYFLGEVEIVFGFWTIPLVIVMSYWYNWDSAVNYLSNCNFREPMMVIVIMSIASTRPILKLAENCLHAVAKLFGDTPAAWWFSLLTIGPLLGSLITEPGAMTITALLLGKQFYSRQPSRPFAYATLGLLFVNVSVGGVLTNFAAPPVIIVAHEWQWTSAYMFMHFGWKAIIAILVANTAYFFIFRKEFGRLQKTNVADVGQSTLLGEHHSPVPVWITIVHVIALAWIVYAGHEPVIFVGAFLLFLGFYQATRPHQAQLKLRPPLLVGLFLAGLVIHGTLQGWWITPIIERLTQIPLLFAATAMTAVNDNALITYLSSLPPNFTESLEYSVVAGAITGGGLTVIANAPNPAGQQILSRYFKNGISPLWLILGALFPTIVMLLAFIFLYPAHMFPSG